MVRPGGLLRANNGLPDVPARSRLSSWDTPRGILQPPRRRRPHHLVPDDVVAVAWAAGVFCVECPSCLILSAPARRASHCWRAAARRDEPSAITTLHAHA